MPDIDFQMTLWWADTASGTASWQDDYTRSRYGIEATYSGTDALYGRKPIADVNP